MLDTPNIVVIALMTLLFLRQFAVYKQASKINYAPIILILGALGVLWHLMLYPEKEPLLMIREAVLPLCISLIFYLILNILNQTQHSSNVLQQEEWQAQFIRDMDTIKQDIAILNEREYHLDDIHTHSMDVGSIKEIFKEDMSALQQIRKNQEMFMKTLEQNMRRYDESMQHFEEFTKSKMPEFDAIIHRHIEILRITEQDHFNQINEALEHDKNAHQILHTNITDMHKLLLSIKQMHTVMTQKMVEQAGLELQRLFTGYETRLSHLQSQSETLNTSMSDTEPLVERLKERSESLIAQMGLISNKIETILQATQTLPNFDHFAETLSTQRQHLRDEIAAVKEEVTTLHQLINTSKNEHDQAVEDAIQTLSHALNEKTEQAITKLYEQYLALQNSNASTIKELASRSKIQKTYLSNSQEL